jgi:hypothetical protein
MARRGSGHDAAPSQAGTDLEGAPAREHRRNRTRVAQNNSARFRALWNDVDGEIEFGGGRVLSRVEGKAVERR